MAARELSAQDAFLFERIAPKPTSHIVILCDLENDRNGNRRYEATVVDVGHLALNGKAGAFRYRFTGHCGTPRDEAEWALDNLHLKAGR